MEARDLGRAIATALLAVAAGCSSSMPPAAPQHFEYKATAVWSTQATPNVTSMTIDGRPYASGQFYTLDETFTSYDDARASFVPKNVIITTTTETATFQIDLGACEAIMPGLLDTPLVMESDQFDTYPSQSQPPAPSVDFGVDCGSCAGKTKVTYYCP